MEAIDYSAAKFYLQLLQLAGLVALGIYTHLTQRSKANTESITVLERRVDVLESQLTRAPTHQDLAVLHKRVTQATQQMENLAGEFRSTNRHLGLIHEHLLNEKRGNR